MGEWGQRVRTHVRDALLFPAKPTKFRLKPRHTRIGGLSAGFRCTGSDLRFQTTNLLPVSASLTGCDDFPMLFLCLTLHWGLQLGFVWDSEYSDSMTTVLSCRCDCFVPE